MTTFRPGPTASSWLTPACWLPALSLSVLALLLACGRSEFEAREPAAAEVQTLAGADVALPVPPQPVAAPVEQDVNDAAVTPDPALETGVAPAKRAEKLIYKAELRVAVKDPEPAAKALIDWVKGNGGYLLEQQGNRLIVRVPSASFQAALNNVMASGELVDRRVVVEDVTEQYFDLEARIRNAEALRTRLTLLLERADKVEDALRIEQELGRVSEQLELLQGKLRRLRELVAFSTVSVEWVQLARESLEASPALPFAWLGTLGLSHLLQSKEY